VNGHGFIDDQTDKIAKSLTYWKNHRELAIAKLPWKNNRELAIAKLP
jgi:hypothetical protein